MSGLLIEYKYQPAYAAIINKEIIGPKVTITDLSFGNVASGKT